MTQVTKSCWLTAFFFACLAGAPTPVFAAGHITVINANDNERQENHKNQKSWWQRRSTTFKLLSTCVAAAVIVNATLGALKCHRGGMCLQRKTKLGATQITPLPLFWNGTTTKEKLLTLPVGFLGASVIYPCILLSKIDGQTNGKCHNISCDIIGGLDILQQKMVK